MSDHPRFASSWDAVVWINQRMGRVKNGRRGLARLELEHGTIAWERAPFEPWHPGGPGRPPLP